MQHSQNPQALVSELNRRFKSASADDVMDAVIGENLIGKLALVSSFGAESAALLHMLSRRDKNTAVLFVDTEFIFPETIDYLKTLAISLDLKDVRRIVPDPARTAIRDAEGTLHQKDQDACCELRKTLPLQRALGEFAGWITGRKRYQATTRATLEYFELDSTTNRIKVNPLIHWDALKIRDYTQRNDLPLHPLVSKGYPSIGCQPCTTKTLPNEDPRSGRWRGTDKLECGIHFGQNESDDNLVMELL